MSTALVVRTQRHKKIGDSNSPMVHTLKRKPQDAKIFDLARIAQDIEALGAMSAEDVEHVGKAIVRQMRQTLTDGNSVRLDGFGIFHTTFKCRATEVAKDCTVKNIERVNIAAMIIDMVRSGDHRVPKHTAGYHCISTPYGSFYLAQGASQPCLQRGVRRRC